jgi:glycosyltransferase involved in cell wall biosynthesis
LYRTLAKRPEINLTVYFNSAATVSGYFDTGFGRDVTWDIDLVGGYQNVSLPRAKSAGHDNRKPNWPLLRKLADADMDVLWIHGYMSANTWLASAIARSKGATVLIREEQSTITPNSSLKKLVKRALLPALFSNVGGLYIGENSRNFLRHYGIPENRLFRAHYCVDNDFFRSRFQELAGRRSELRRSFGIHDSDPVILFSGKLIDKKRPQLLLEAFHRVRSAAACHLLVAGDGPLRGELENQAAKNGTSGIHWAGFLNQTELPAAYVAADVFVLPSAYQETWGLVVNEAMNFELPVVVSDRVGCAPDLVREGENGFVFSSDDVSGLADALTKLVKNEQMRKTFGHKSAEIISGYSIDRCADQIVEAAFQSAGKIWI